MLQEDEDIALASVADKGKRKEREEFGLGDDKGHEPLYPPMSEDAEETRRVEEVRTCLVIMHMFYMFFARTSEDGK